MTWKWPELMSQTLRLINFGKIKVRLSLTSALSWFACAVNSAKSQSGPKLGIITLTGSTLPSAIWTHHMITWTSLSVVTLVLPNRRHSLGPKINSQAMRSEPSNRKFTIIFKRRETNKIALAISWYATHGLKSKCIYIQTTGHFFTSLDERESQQ